MVRVLVNEPPIKVDTQTVTGETALFLAARYNHLESLKLLLAKGASVNLANQDNYTPTNIAQENKHTVIERALKRAGGRVNDDLITTADKNAAKNYVVEGHQMMSKRKYKAAVTAYKKVLKLNPNNGTALFNLAAIYSQHLKNLPAAEEAILEAIRVNPLNPENLYLAGRIYHLMNRPDKYKPLFKRYVALAPDTFNAKDLVNNYSQYLK